MAEYFRSLTAAAVVTLIMTQLSPGGFEKYMKYIAALAAAVIMLSPLGALPADAEKILTDLSDAADKITVSGETGIADTNEAILQTSVETLCRNLQSLLSERYRTAPDNLRISMLLDTSDPGSVEIQKITVTLLHDAKFLDCREMEKYIADMFVCDAAVRYGDPTENQYDG